MRTDLGRATVDAEVAISGNKLIVQVNSDSARAVSWYAQMRLVVT